MATQAFEKSKTDKEVKGAKEGSKAEMAADKKQIGMPKGIRIAQRIPKKNCATVI